MSIHVLFLFLMEKIGVHIQNTFNGYFGNKNWLHVIKFTIHRSSKKKMGKSKFLMILFSNKLVPLPFVYYIISVIKFLLFLKMSA